MKNFKPKKNCGLDNAEMLKYSYIGTTIGQNFVQSFSALHFPVFQKASKCPLQPSKDLKNLIDGFKVIP